ncbi:MAG: hypothetical protein ACKVH0_11055, partial [Alphaproteobacteria bacterium]
MTSTIHAEVAANLSEVQAKIMQAAKDGAVDPATVTLIG